jgi:uncharacterized protein involved in exopolysaccharide biosynthesis
MVVKILDTFFRHKVLILLPAVLIPLIVAPISLLTASAYYEATAGIWVARPTYIKYDEEASRYSTPAKEQADRLNELLRSRSFLLDVAQRTSLAPWTGSAKGEEALRNTFEKSLGMTPSNNMLVVRFRADSPQLAYEVVTALLDVFQEKMMSDRTDQAALAISFWESRLQETRAKLAKSDSALRRYVQSNPQLATTDLSRPATVTPGSLDRELVDLRLRVQMDERDVDNARASLERIQFDAAAAQEGQEVGFQVIDPPQVPVTATRDIKKRIIFPVAGALFGFGLSLTILLLLVAADGTVRSETDLASPIRVVGVVPQIPIKNRKHLGPESARRRIASGAAMALPAPPGAR